MKTDLEILIEHLQAEYDYLKLSMDQCIEEWDFDGAKAFREPLLFTKRKLNVLKCLENPNFNMINHLERKISRIEKRQNDSKPDMDYLDEQTSQNIKDRLQESYEHAMNALKAKLEKLKLVEPKKTIDDDKILEVLEGLEQNKITTVEFEIKKGKLFLLLTVNNEQGELEFRTPKDVKMEHYMTNARKSILRELGFNTDQFKKQISNFNKLDKLKVLEDLAIIYFEVFEIFGEERNIKFE